MKEKQLQLNLDKTVYMICGNNEQVQHVKDQISKTPLIMNDAPMKVVDFDKYLGDMIHCDGNEASIEATVKSRHWRLKAYCKTAD